MSLAMSRAEREAFLAETRVAIVSIAELATTYPDGTSREVTVRLRPERWWSADFRKLGGGA
jgi:hypothetical protein